MLIALTLLLGCPEPPPDAGAGGAGTEMGAPGQPGQPGPGGQASAPGLPGEGGGTGPAPEAGPGAGAAPMYNAQLEFTQDKLTGETVTVSGTLSCSDSQGPFLIHLFPPPPQGAEGEINDAPPQPVTGIKLGEPGSFEMQAPVGLKVVVLAFADEDGNEMPSEAGIFFGNEGKPLKLNGDVTVTLDCSKVAPPLASDGTPDGPANPPAPAEAPVQGADGAAGPPLDGSAPAGEGAAPGVPEGAPSGEMGPPGDPPTGGTPTGEMGPPGEPPAGGPPPQ